MATRALSGAWIARNVHRTTWTGLLNGDDGAPQSALQLADKSVQVKGTFGAGGTLLIEGSNDDGTTWATLNDSRGETTGALSFTAADLRTILENCQLIRPRVSAGDGTTSLTCIVVAESVG